MAPFKKLRSRLTSGSKGSTPSTPEHQDKLVVESGVPSSSSSSSPQPSSKARPKGLIALKDFPTSEYCNTQVDVVAIHGLNGHALNTWMDGNTIWFRDLLPSLVQAASLRILSYGYSSEILSSGAKYQMLDFVLGLFSALETLRRSTNTKNIPIFFICHSLGGILFKKCLLMANERKELYGSIVTSTRGVAFFGTPHRGSGSASLSKTCLDIGHVFYPNLRSDLVQSLKRTAEELADIGFSVPELLQPLSIVTAYETRPLELLTLAGIVVSRESALLYLANEMAIPIDADHRAICRFSDPNNPKFRPVLLAIADAITRSAEIRSQAYEEFLIALYFDGFQRRRFLLPDSYEGTFRWIWDHDRFKEWMSGGSKMLWIQGKPASGKSTMMKFIRHGLAEGPYAKNHNHIVVDFFYSIRGGDVEQEHVSMLRSIIWQVISPYPSLWSESLVLLLYKLQATSSPSSISDEPGSMTKWFSNWLSVKNLQSLLLLICQHEIRTPITIYVLVDAMDESELLNRRKIAMSLLDLTISPSEGFSCPVTIKVLVASRPDPMTEAVSDRCIRMNFESQTDQDIKLYIEKSLASLVQQLPSLKHGDWSVIQQTLQGKCQGIFLWVKLIFLELEEKYHREGCTMQEMEDILISIPPGLDSLYARMFLVIEAQTISQRRETEAMLAWTVDDPVSHDEMNDIIAIAACSDCELTGSTLSRNRLGSHAEIEKRVSSRCVNFLEWKRSQDSPGICQFIHATALQFITAKLSNVEQLLEDQAMKYARFVVDSDPGWLFLAESWPNFQTEQLKRTNLPLAIDLFYTPTLPLFGRILRLRKGLAEKNLPHRDDVFGIQKPPSVLLEKLYLALLLSAAVQANHNAILSLKPLDDINLIEYYCFDADINTQDQLYTSFTVRSVDQWFSEDECNDESTAFERRSLFCDLISILAMFTGLEKIDHVAAAAIEQDWFIPCPSEKDDLLWFVSAARQGNTALASLYFVEWREPERMIRRRHQSPIAHLAHRISGSYQNQENIVSIALDYNQIPFATMMFEEDYVRDMRYVDTPDKQGRTALDRACEQNLVDIAKGIYPRYADPGLDGAGIEKLREKARKNGHMEIAGVFEAGADSRIEELGCG